MAFFFAGLLRRRLRRGYRINSQCSETLPEGPIEKLLICEGLWEKRQWNDRWLKANVTDNPQNPAEIFYCSEGKKLMNRIAHQDICKVGMLRDLIKIELPAADEILSPSTSPSLWELILKNRSKFQELEMCFYISTLPKGSRKGKEYLFKAKTAEDLKKWSEVVKSLCAKGRGEGPLSKFRRKCRNVYKSRPFEIGVGLMICVNFGIIVLEKQTLPAPGSEMYSVIADFNFILSAIFAFELLLNIFVSKFSDFCQDYWNW